MRNETVNINQSLKLPKPPRMFNFNKTLTFFMFVSYGSLYFLLIFRNIKTPVFSQIQWWRCRVLGKVIGLPIIQILFHWWINSVIDVVCIQLLNKSQVGQK